MVFTFEVPDKEAMGNPVAVLFRANVKLTEFTAKARSAAAVKREDTKAASPPTVKRRVSPKKKP